MRACVRAYGTEAGSQPATVHHFDLGLGLYAKEEKKMEPGSISSPHPSFIT
jgi:hypothetical protein